MGQLELLKDMFFESRESTFLIGLFNFVIDTKVIDLSDLSTKEPSGFVLDLLKFSTKEPLRFVFIFNLLDLTTEESSKSIVDSEISESPKSSTKEPSSKSIDQAFWITNILDSLKQRSSEFIIPDLYE